MRRSRCGALLGCVIVAALWGARPSRAQFTPREAPDATVVESGSDAYAFHSFAVNSVDGKRGYAIVVGVPRHAPPSAAGYPAIYLLDGDAVIAALDDPLLARLEQSSEAPVLVAIGYAGPNLFATEARAFDYTPPDPHGRPVADNAGRPGGGGREFLQLIEQAIRPRVEQIAPIHPDRRSLWGHSYGGLFTLYTALAHPASFQRYVAASPSIWWDYGSVLELEPAFLSRARPDRFALRLMVGETEQRPRASGGSATPSMRTSVAPDAAQQLAQRLTADGVAVTVDVFPGLGHGAMFGAALRGALLAMVEACEEVVACQ